MGRPNHRVGRPHFGANRPQLWREDRHDPLQGSAQCFHTYRWREPTFQAIKGPPLTPLNSSFHTHSRRRVVVGLPLVSLEYGVCEEEDRRRARLVGLSSSCTSMDTIHFSKYPEFVFWQVLGLVFLSYSFVYGFIIRSRSGYSSRGPLIKTGNPVRR